MTRPLAINCMVALALVLWLAAVILVTLGGRAYPHQSPGGMQYDETCCNGNNHSGDCQPIPASTVQPIGGGFVIKLVAGDHRLVTKPHEFRKAISETRRSTDGQYHACLYPDENTLRCFYAPPMGM